jgi:hypothetical protein
MTCSIAYKACVVYKLPILKARIYGFQNSLLINNRAHKILQKNALVRIEKQYLFNDQKLSVLIVSTTLSVLVMSFLRVNKKPCNNCYKALIFVPWFL